MFTMPTMFPLATARDRFTRRARPRAQGQAQLGPQLTAGLQVQRLVDRLVRHPQSLVPGELFRQSTTHLPRGPLVRQPVPDRLVQPFIFNQNTFVRPTPVPVRAFLGRNRPIRPPATMPVDLPRHNRLMPPQNHSNRPTRQPTRKLPRNHLPFLHAQHHTPHPTPPRHPQFPRQPPTLLAHLPTGALTV